ncbi:hypothetical protein C8J56DRAFT_927133 [Mycena floridula]|nr:hypothetical protein C8J56DRAFT_927133 [Mycena floridula]
MQALPRPILPLIYASLTLSTISLACSIRPATQVTPFLWSTTAAFLITVPFQIILILAARLEPLGSEKLFSKFNIIWAFVISFCWTLACGTSVGFTIRGGIRQIQSHQLVDLDLYFMLVLSITTMAECIVVYWLAFSLKKERKRITYAAKWRPINHLTFAQTWSIGQA